MTNDKSRNYGRLKTNKEIDGEKRNIKYMT